MGIKRIAILAAVIAAIGTLVLFSRGSDRSTRLRVSSWSSYFPERSLLKFTSETGIPVELSYFSSNEELFAKLKAGATGYDIILPSDYMVRQMIRLKMVQPLQKEKLPHLSHLDPDFRNLPYDPGCQYTVPLTWGTSGIAINTEKVSVPEDGVSWKMLLESSDPKHTSLLDDMREVFAAALLSKGLSVNTKDKKILESARADIARVKDRILMFSSEPKSLLLRGELNIAHIYSTDGVTATKENPRIKYFIPKEGAVLWTDNMAIPVTSKRAEAAHRFIDFFLDPENALALAVGNQLATPNKTVRTELDPSILDDKNQYPTPEGMKRLEMLGEMGETLGVMSLLWTEIKS